MDQVTTREKRAKLTLEIIVAVPRSVNCVYTLSAPHVKNALHLSLALAALLGFDKVSPVRVIIPYTHLYYTHWTIRTHKYIEIAMHAVSITNKKETTLENRLLIVLTSISVFDNVQLAVKGDSFALKWFITKIHKTISCGIKSKQSLSVNTQSQPRMRIQLAYIRSEWTSIKSNACWNSSFSLRIG